MPAEGGSLVLSDDSGEVGTSLGASAKGDSAAFAAADQSVMSSIDSSVQWRDNETASAMWHENPLNVLAGDSLMSSHSVQLPSTQPTACASSSLMRVAVNPLAAGASRAAYRDAARDSL